MQATMELEERVYDAVDVTHGVYERSKESTSTGNTPPQPSAYKSLLKQNVTNMYANIGQSDTAIDMIARNGAKHKGQVAIMILLSLGVFFSILLSLTALGIAIASIVTVAEYKGQLDSLTKLFNEHMLTNNHTSMS